MKRRDFFKRTVPLAVTPFLLNALPLQTFASPSMLTSFGSCDSASERKLVLIQLIGGNDGLNTIIPIAQYNTYASIRPSIRIAENKYINLDNNLNNPDKVGLHPALNGLKSLYDNNQLNIIQGVGYNNPNQSHFKSSDLWMTGGDGSPNNFNFDTGWMGRYLTNTFPEGFGTTPLGIQLGNSKPSLGFHSNLHNGITANIANTNLNNYNSISGLGGTLPTFVPDSDYGDELQYIMDIQNSTSAFASSIKNTFAQGGNNSYYPNTNLSNQLKTVARLISGGSETKIFLCTMFGFDTHTNQVNSNDTSNGGRHVALLKELSDAITAFQNDLNAQSLSHKVLTATFSEFGRQANENGNLGTDHGTLAPMFIIGEGVRGGVTGTNVNLSNLIDDNTQLTGMQHDYRQVYATILQDWLGADEEILGATYFNNFNKLNFIEQNHKVDPSCYGGAVFLPIELTYFNAQAIERDLVQLTWETAIEHNNEYFNIERSPDGKSFRSIARVKSQGESDTPKFYESFDKAPLRGTSYYRLKQVDYNGKTTYSEIQSVYIEDERMASIKIYPNPAIYDAQLVLTSNEDYTAKMSIINTMGQIVIKKSIQVNQGFNKFSIDVRALATGTYFVHFIHEGGKYETLNLVVHK